MRFSMGKKMFFSLSWLTLSSKSWYLFAKLLLLQSSYRILNKSDSFTGSSLVVQWLKTSLSIAGGAGLISGRGAKIPHASWPKNQNIKQKQYCNKFNKDFKNGPHQKNKQTKKTSLKNWKAWTLLSLMKLVMLHKKLIKLITGVIWTKIQNWNRQS